ncbi:hypothetical protein [Xanthomarina gelatinilytica]|uniref:hypothetical protein n=1 Tax=Xanthomarina gelatinilytica TaxID=1137281 RepID=UPI003AA7C554
MKNNNSVQPFFFNVIPFGIEKHQDKNKLWLNFSVKFNIDLNNPYFVKNDDASNLEFVKLFIKASEFIKNNDYKSSFKLNLPNSLQLKGELIPIEGNDSSLRQNLWDKFFEKEKKYFNNDVKPYPRNLLKEQISEPEYFQDPKTLTSKSFIKKFANRLDNMRTEDINIFNIESIYNNEEFKGKAKENYDNLVSKSNKIAAFSNSMIELKNREANTFFKKFIKKRIDNTNVAKFIFDFSLTTSQILSDEDILDINEVLYRYNAIEENKHLARLFGIIKDYRVEITKSELIDLQNQELEIQSSFSQESELVKHLPSKIKFIALNNKFACLLSSRNGYSDIFYNSVLKSENSIVQSYNELAFENAFENNSIITNQATRGIIYRNTKLKDIIKPINETPQVFDDESLTSGYRVAMNDGESIKSLTVRSNKPNLEGYNFNLFDEEVGIKIDAAMQYMDDGTIKTTISDQIFNYEGELFNLNSPFGKNESANNNEPKTERDLSLELAESKLKKLVSYSVFPSNSYENNNSFIKYRYSIPKKYLNNQTDVPKLRFFKTYRFVVYQEYDNGWGLPLKAIDGADTQLSIEDLISGKEKSLLSKDFEFIPLEDKQQVQLFNRFEQNFTKKEVKEDFIVKSDDYGDNKQLISQKHCLGPRIEFETAWLFNEFDEIRSKTYEIKRKANCEFDNEDDYNHSEGKCCEGCTKYCGGTQMKEYYNQKHIEANYLTDPTVNGINAKLLLMNEVDEIDKLSEPIYFKLNKNSKVIDQKSILLKASGGDKKSFFKVNSGEDILDINIKKGAELYLYLSNNLTSFGQEQLEKGWWDNGLKYFKKGEEIRKNLSYKTIFKKVAEEQNKPKKIKLVHAVKEPLIAPQIVSLNSFAKNSKQTSHIPSLFKNKYASYALDKNVIANRIELTKDEFIGSPKVSIQLKALFERLDCFKAKENKISFINEVLPTGSLELWMRKEKYIDDKEEYIFPQSNSNQRISPDMPLVYFEDEKNIFSLEHKIEFSEEVLEQLRNNKKFEIKDGKSVKDIVDEFVEIISNVNFQVDIKSSCFEEREYFLRNTSKFIGYFDSNNKYQPKLNSRGEIDLENDTEEFSLPTENQVIKDLDKNSPFRFKTLVLNNQKPTKPIVKYSITTIQERREYLNRKNIISTQKGNIVTIYFERGRLTSGKNERIGLIINSDGVYNKAFKQRNLISKVGKDIVSDKHFPSNHEGYLKYDDIIIPVDNDYNAEFNDKLGIFHYLPHFDIEKQLWKIEIELNIKTKNNKDLHNPFINFALVNYQPFSINYANNGNDFQRDCRLSDVETSTWCYLLPERQLSVAFDFPGFLDRTGKVELTLAFDHESLNHDLKSGKIRSNIILSIEGSNDELIWYPVHSKNAKTNYIACHHALIDKDLFDSEIDYIKKAFEFDTRSTVSPFNENKWIKYKEYRVRLVEVEWFIWDSPIDFDNVLEDVLNDQRFKVRYVEIIK